jgi:peptidoglycan/LPS O-acetylase OafA/YrhL
MSLLFLALFMVPVVVLGWRLVVTKSRKRWIRVGAAAAATISAVGALHIFDNLTDFSLKDWRNDIALVASMVGSAYLFAWAQRHRGNRRHRTISIIAAIVGVIPAVGAIATALMFQE